MDKQPDEQQQPSTQTSRQSPDNVTLLSPEETTSNETSTEHLSILLTSWCTQQSPTVKPTTHVRQLQCSENGFEIWRQLRQRFSGGQRAQQLRLLQRIMYPKWTEAQQGHQFNQWVIDMSRYEQETATPIEESIKIATRPQKLERSSAPRSPTLCSTNDNLERGVQHRPELPRVNVGSSGCPLQPTSQPSRKSTTSKRAKQKERIKERAKEAQQQQQ